MMRGAAGCGLRECGQARLRQRSTSMAMRHVQVAAHTSSSFCSRAPAVGALIAANAPPLGFSYFQTLGGVYLLS